MSAEKHQKRRNFRIYCASAFVIYLLVVLYITVFCREPEERRVDLELFRSYRLLLIDKNDFYYGQIVCNIVMTVPFGILLPLISKKFRSFFLMLVSGLIFSLLIELIQYFTGRGLFEVDDLFNNTLGALLGYLILCILIRTFSAGSKKK